MAVCDSAGLKKQQNWKEFEDKFCCKNYKHVGDIYTEAFKIEFLGLSFSLHLKFVWFKRQAVCSSEFSVLNLSWKFCTLLYMSVK